jgi:hypothetical protein
VLDEHARDHMFDCLGSIEVLKCHDTEACHNAEIIQTLIHRTNQPVTRNSEGIDENDSKNLVF